MGLVHKRPMKRENIRQNVWAVVSGSEVKKAAARLEINDSLITQVGSGTGVREGQGIMGWERSHYSEKCRGAQLSS